MGKYSIRELEKLSGIKAHTIRIWEKRYQLIRPERTTSNIRFYSDDDLKKIINVSVLNASGLKISSIARMTTDELHREILALSSKANETNIHVDNLVTSMLDMDEAKFKSELSSIEEKSGFENMVTGVIYPFLEKIGIFWQTGNITPAHEHFISNLIRERIIVATASLPLPPDTAIRALLFLCEDELHEIGLLYYHYLARKNGFKTYYLGQSVPFADLKEAYNIHKPHLLITSMTSSPAPHLLDNFMQTLCSEFLSSRILASGFLLKNTSFRVPKNLTLFRDVTELKDILLQIKGR